VGKGDDQPVASQSTQLPGNLDPPATDAQQRNPIEVASDFLAGSSIRVPLGFDFAKSRLL
jgi:hypothetical protein